MIGSKRNSEFCFPETLNIPRGEARGNIEVEGKQNSLFLEGLVIKCFVLRHKSKIEKEMQKSFLDASWLTNLLWFQGACPDHVQVESSGCCFPKELVSFVRPREIASLDPQHMTHSVQSENLF